MNEIQIFNNAEFGSIRTAEVNGTPCFVGKDVAEVLGYSNTRDALARHVDSEDKADVVIHDGSQNRTMTVINESGLYSLILSSKLPKAKEFKHWVTSEVLPSIRKHGAYMTEQTLEQALTSPDFLIKLATQLKAEQEKNRQLETTVNKQNELLERAKPKICFANCVKTAETSILVGELAKILRQNGIMERGWFEIKETVISHSDGHTSISKTPKVTGRGQIYFINRFMDGERSVSNVGI